MSRNCNSKEIKNSVETSLSKVCSILVSLFPVVATGDQVNEFHPCAALTDGDESSEQQCPDSGFHLRLCCRYLAGEHTGPRGSIPSSRRVSLLQVPIDAESFLAVVEHPVWQGLNVTSSDSGSSSVMLQRRFVVAQGTPTAVTDRNLHVCMHWRPTVALNYDSGGSFSIPTILCSN
ncbi:unnamed protein product [Urochloa humidicola]